MAIDVKQGSTELQMAVPLTQSAGTWSVTIADLPAGVALTFTAHAYSATPTEIFSGTTQATLSATDANSITIDMAPTDSGNLTLPRIVSIAVPSEITVSTSVTVLIDLEGSADETLNWTLTAETNGGSFDPASGSLPLSSGGTGTLSVTYTAPVTEGTYTHTIHVTNSAGNAVEADFPTVVVIAVAAGGLSVRFPPVVTAITGKRSGSTVTWTATAAGDESCCDHAWSASLSGGTSPALRDPPTSNPAFLDGYDQTVNGTVSVQVSDGTGLSTTATVILPGGQFADSLVVSDVWTSRAPMLVGGGFPTAAVNGNILVFRDSFVHVYHPADNTWTYQFSLPFYNVQNSAVAVANGIIYFAGSTQNPDWIQFYDPSSNTWSGTSGAPFPLLTGRTAAAVDGVIYLFGGYKAGNAYNRVDTYNPSSNTWSTKTPMPTFRYGAASEVVNGIVYVFGGHGSGLGDEIEAYDPASDTWTTKDPMPTVREGHASALIHGLVYIVGGYDYDAPIFPSYTASVQAYDPATESWSDKASLPIGRGFMRTALIDGILYTVGGYAVNESHSSYPLDLVDAYTP
jgi:hypothetical protein